jgi:hypothetical protein
MRLIQRLHGPGMDVPAPGAFPRVITVQTASSVPNAQHVELYMVSQNSMPAQMKSINR